MYKGFTNSRAQSAVREYTPKKMIWGIDPNEVPYAIKHQLGEGVPKRKPLQISKSGRRKLVKIMQRYLQEDLKLTARRLAGVSVRAAPGSIAYRQILGTLKRGTYQ